MYTHWFSIPGSSRSRLRFDVGDDCEETGFEADAKLKGEGGGGPDGESNWAIGEVAGE